MREKAVAALALDGPARWRRLPHDMKGEAGRRPARRITVERTRLPGAGSSPWNGSGYQQESMIRGMENAYRLLKSPERTAFDLQNEPRASYDAYNTGRFGLGCLLARRLVESGARFVEVTFTASAGFEGAEFAVGGQFDRTTFKGLVGMTGAWTHPNRATVWPPGWRETPEPAVREHSDGQWAKLVPDTTNALSQ